MARYKCPIETCNVTFEGTIWDIAPQAIGHADGSHKMILSEKDVSEIINKQARGEPTEAQPVESGPKSNETWPWDDDWWKK